MSLQPPADVAWVLDLLDVNWPEADEDGLHAAADAYREYADDLTRLTRRASHAAAALGTVNSGPPVTAFSAHWAKFDTNGTGHLPDAAAVARIMAGALDAVALAVIGAKTAVAAHLVTCATQLRAARIATPMTIETADTSAQKTIQETVLAVREILDDLGRSMMQVASEAVRGSALAALATMVEELSSRRPASQHATAGDDGTT